MIWRQTRGSVVAISATNSCCLVEIFREDMSLWVDKHRPTSLSKLDYHKDLSCHLKRLVSNKSTDTDVANSTPFH